MTPQALAGLRNRVGVADVLERHRWLTTAVGSAALGVAVTFALVFAGTSAPVALAAGGAAAAATFALVVAASWILGRPIILDLVEGENEPGELYDDTRFATEALAAAEATRRNMREGDTGAYWIEVQVESGDWAVELRGRRKRQREGEADDLPSGTFDW